MRERRTQGAPIPAVLVRLRTHIRAAHCTLSAEASFIRLFFSELVQRIDVLAMEILGSSAITGFAPDGAPHDEWAERYLTGLSQTIGGGTKEIQRNIIGERVLGLPR